LKPAASHHCQAILKILQVSGNRQGRSCRVTQPARDTVHEEKKAVDYCCRALGDRHIGLALD
jgi:hypothetical protein